MSAQVTTAVAIDDAFVSTFVFSVALSAINVMAPEDRGLLFIVTLVVSVLMVNEVAIAIQKKQAEMSENTGENEFINILANLVTEIARLISSLLSAALGKYITDLMGKTIVDQPGYALCLTAIIISMLYLAKRSLFTKNKKQA